MLSQMLKKRMQTTLKRLEKALKNPNIIIVNSAAKFSWIRI
jgi:hypothetical protein